MLGITKIEIAKAIFMESLGELITKLVLDTEDPKFLSDLRDGTRVYIQYNDNDQSSYSLLFSEEDFDRCRFDNYDKFWGVTSTPHHFHPRNTKEGYFSPMNGDPNADFILFCEMIKKGKLFDQECRFEEV